MSNNNNQPPPWSEAPPWAKYRAQDSDGEWWWFENKPKLNSSEWHAQGRVEFIAKSTGWKETLQKRPKNE